MNYLNITATIIRDEALRAAKAGDTSAAWRIARALGTLTDYCYYESFGGAVSDEVFDEVRDMYLACEDDIDAEWRKSDSYAALKAWVDNPDNRRHENYSDIHKDVYGFRPRW